MNRFEKAVYECMDPVEALLQRTENPLHRAILENFRRHVHLEGSGQFDKITAPDMSVDNPVYRVSWGDTPALIEGKEGVIGFYNSVTEAVLWNSDDLIAVNDWGIADELTFNQLIKGSDLQNLGYTADSPDAYYHLRSRQAFIWPYNDQALLMGENLYEDKTSVEITQIDESELITPQRVAEIHREQLARLEAEKGPNWWVYK
ncbi:hypothetical protein N9E57_04175 [Gammaproteobacteria bacterium]|jgi:hypothetical protein|nr:hypothetical protein [Gammaproteobacteria bacterium]MDA9909698.1 hypothetical protein [Gammaproteobacteria bacterium]